MLRRTFIERLAALAGMAVVTRQVPEVLPQEKALPSNIGSDVWYCPSKEFPFVGSRHADMPMWDTPRSWEPKTATEKRPRTIAETSARAWERSMYAIAQEQSVWRER